jgi:hypothetical protein
MHANAGAAHVDPHGGTGRERSWGNSEASKLRRYMQERSLTIPPAIFFAPTPLRKACPPVSSARPTRLF